MAGFRNDGYSIFQGDQSPYSGEDSLAVALLISGQLAFHNMLALQVVTIISLIFSSIVEWLVSQRVKLFRPNVRVAATVKGRT